MKVRWWHAGTIFVRARIQSRGQPCAYCYGLEKDGVVMMMVMMMMMMVMMGEESDMFVQLYKVKQLSRI